MTPRTPAGERFEWTRYGDQQHESRDGDERIRYGEPQHGRASDPLMAERLAYEDGHWFDDVGSSGDRSDLGPSGDRCDRTDEGLASELHGQVGEERPAEYRTCAP